MDISITEFKQHCLAIIRRVEQTGEPVTITRRGKAVARLQAAPANTLKESSEPWEALRAMGGRLLARPDESALDDRDFEALR